MLMRHLHTAAYLALCKVAALSELSLGGFVVRVMGRQKLVLLCLHTTRIRQLHVVHVCSGSNRRGCELFCFFEGMMDERSLC